MKFEIGEIAIVKNSVGGFDGVEVEIVKELSPRHIIGYSKDVMVYRIVIAGETAIRNALPSQLRKKKPPEEASWEEIQKSIGWNPTKQGVEV